MQVLIDSSVWIDYFRGTHKENYVDYLLDENLVATNELILTELTPFLKLKNQRKVIHLLKKIPLLKLNIDWQQICDYQYQCLQQGINGIGIPDLIIAQNAIQHRCWLYSLDCHFKFLSKVTKLKLIE